MIFKVGDKVNFMGFICIIKKSEHPKFPIKIVANHYTVCFTEDGRFLEEHTESSLKLVECGECDFTSSERSSHSVGVYCSRCGKEKAVEKSEKKKMRYYLIPMFKDNITHKTFDLAFATEELKFLNRPIYGIEYAIKLESDTHRQYIEIEE